MISAKKEKMLFSSLEKGGRYGTRKPGTHHLRLPYGGSRLPRPVCLQGLQVILLHLPGAGILMSILRELFRKFPFFLPVFCRTGVGRRRRARYFPFSFLPPECLQLPVCARHTVRPAELVRRRLRFTPEVNSGYLPPSARPSEDRSRAPER